MKDFFLFFFYSPYEKRGVFNKYDDIHIKLKCHEFELLGELVVLTIRF